MSSSEVATIQFLKWQPLYEKEKPFQLFVDLPAWAPDQRKTNLVFETMEVDVRNIRGEEKRFKLDDHGFTYRTMEGFADLGNKNEVVERYLPAVEGLLKENVKGADRVCVFDWRMRDSDAKAQDGFFDVGNSMLPLQPANFAHSDQAPGSVIQRVRAQFPEEAEELFKGRIRVLNVWKPLRNKVMDWPLAMCDGSTLCPSDLVETDTIRVTNVSANLYSQYSPETQNWVYLKEQQPSEVVIFKQFDSDPDVKAPLSLHAAFKHKNLPATYIPRKSVEVRAIVFTNAANGEIS